MQERTNKNCDQEKQTITGTDLQKPGYYSFPAKRHSVMGKSLGVISIVLSIISIICFLLVLFEFLFEPSLFDMLDDVNNNPHSDIIIIKLIDLFVYLMVFGIVLFPGIALTFAVIARANGYKNRISMTSLILGAVTIGFLIITIITACILFVVGMRGF